MENDLVTMVSFFQDFPNLVSLASRALVHYREWESQPKTYDWEQFYLGFQYHHLDATPQECQGLYKTGVLKISHKASRKPAWYAVANPGKLGYVLETLRELQEQITRAQEAHSGLPQDLFSTVIGYEPAKKLVLRALEAPRPVHFLLIGPPASAKTMFLMELNRLPGAEYYLGSSTSRAGLSTRLLENKPRLVLIDEMDKMPADDQDILLSLCETGIVKETKYQRYRQVELKDTRVFAAANLANFRPEIVSRFEVLKFDAYNQVDFDTVVIELLKQRENMPVELGSKIASVLWDLAVKRKAAAYLADPREAIRIARLMKEPTQEELGEVLSLLEEYR